MPNASLFLTCTNDLFYPSVGRSCVRALEALGVAVHFPEAQTCCGQPWINTGHSAEARRLALHFLSVFESADAIVSPSSSCVDTVRNGYPELFAGEPDAKKRFESLASRTWEFCEYLHRVLGVTDLPPHPAPRPTTYHSSCRTLRGVGLRGVTEGYLGQMLGASFIPLPEAESCCGFGGSFSVKLPEISGKLLEDKLRHIAATGAEVVAALDMSCLTHLSAGHRHRKGGRLRFVHFAEVLADALGVGEP